MAFLFGDEENNEQNDLGATPESGFLAGIKSKKTTPSPNVNDIYSSSPKNAREAAIYNRMASYESGDTGALPESTYYPSASNNINKGSYSGSIVGNVPIFASSSLFPQGVVDAREKALHEAALIKAQQMDKIRQYYTTPPDTKNPFQNNKLHDEFFHKFIDPAKEQAIQKWGKDWEEKLYKDPDFIRTYDNYVNLAKQHDFLVDQVARVQKDIGDKDKYVSPETIGEMQSVLSGASNLHLSGTNIKQSVDNLTTYKNVDSVINDSIEHAKPLITEEIKKNGGLSTPVEQAVESVKKKFYPPEAIHEMATRAYEEGGGAFGPSGHDLSWYEKKIGAGLQSATEKQVQFAAKMFRPEQGSGPDYSEGEDIVYNQPVSFGDVVRSGETGKESDKINDASYVSAAKIQLKGDQQKPLKISKGASMINVHNNIPVKGEGELEVSPGEISVVPVYKDNAPSIGGKTIAGTLVDESRLSEGGRQYIEYKPMVIGKHLQKKAHGNGFDETTVAIPLDQVGHSALVKNKKGDFNGLPVERLNEIARQKNHESASVAPTQKGNKLDQALGAFKQQTGREPSAIELNKIKAKYGQ